MQRAGSLFVAAQMLVLRAALLLVARLRSWRSTGSMRQRVGVIVVDQIMHAGRLTSRSTDSCLTGKIQRTRILELRRFRAQLRSTRMHLVGSATGCNRWLRAHSEIQRSVWHRMHSVGFEFVFNGIAAHGSRRWTTSSGLRQRWNAALLLEISFAEHLVLLLGNRMS